MTTINSIISPTTTTTTSTLSRSAYLDNLRSFLIVLVVLGHAILPYTSFIDWWYVPVDESHPLFDLLVAIFNVIIMPPIFFIAGYFLVPTVSRKGWVLFWRERVKKLLLPWLTCVILISPLLTYTRYWHITAEPLGYGEYLNLYLSGFQNFYIGILDSFDAVERHHIWWHHLWFIPTLLLLTLSATIHFILRPQAFAKIHARSELPLSVRGVLPFVLISLGLFLAASAWIPDYAYQNIVFLNVFKAQPTRFVLYMMLFFAGIYWYQHRNLTESVLLRLKAWHHIALVIFIIAYLGIMQTITQKSDVPLALHTIEAFAVTLTIWVALFWFLSLAKKHLSFSSTLSQKLSAESFNIYLCHYPLVVCVHFLLAPLEVPIILKGIIAFTALLFLSFIISRTLLSPHPRITVALLIILQIGLVQI